MEDILHMMPDYAKDVRLNLASILSSERDELLSETARHAIVLACAYATRHRGLIDLVRPQCALCLSEQTMAAAGSAVTIMAMNNVYYRSVHMLSNAAYGQMPAQLRMRALTQHGIDPDLFEMMSLAVSSINGCSRCLDAHAHVLETAGKTPETIQCVLRVAAVMQAVAQVFAIEGYA